MHEALANFPGQGGVWKMRAARQLGTDSEDQISAWIQLTESLSCNFLMYQMRLTKPTYTCRVLLEDPDSQAPHISPAPTPPPQAALISAALPWFFSAPY